MPRIDAQVISQGEDLPPHSFYKQFMAPARKIGTAYRTCKQGISGKYDSRSMEAHATG